MVEKLFHRQIIITKKLNKTYKSLNRNVVLVLDTLNNPINVRKSLNSFSLFHNYSLISLFDLTINNVSNLIKLDVYLLLL